MSTLNNHNLVAVMGGTFDPIHHGHLRSALELQQLLGLSEVRLLPCHQPTHRGHPGADSQQRLTMLQLATDNELGLVVDPREITLDQPSYSVYTLESMRQELGRETVLCWVLGVDAFAAFTRWHQWQRILELANLIVITRPGFELDDNSAEYQLWQEQQIDHQMLSEHVSGKIIPVRLPSQLEISATFIRDQLKTGQSARYLLPENVLNYLESQGLYRE